MIKFVKFLPKLSINLIFLAFLCLQIFGTAKAADKAIDFSFGLGAGIQYAGIIGARVNARHNNHNLYGSVGFIGIGFGYDYAVARQLTFGINVAEILAGVSAFGANVTYNFNAAFEKGLRAGIDVIHFSNRLNDFSPVRLSISIGYQFN